MRTLVRHTLLAVFLALVAGCPSGGGGGGSNHAPEPASDSAMTAEDESVAIDVVANDVDADDDALFVSGVTDGANGIVTLLQSGDVQYYPDPEFSGTDSFTYTVSDGELTSDAQVTVTVSAVGDAPVALDDDFTIDEDGTLTVDAAGGILGNDEDIDSSVITAVLDIDVTDGTLALAADGSFTYTPNANFNGTDSFTYYATDGAQVSEIVGVVIDVTAVNDAPEVSDDDYATNEDVPLVVAAGTGVLGNDTDIESDAFTAALGDAPANGMVTLGMNGSFTYTPNANFNGTDTFTYIASDADDSTPATVTITIGAVNDGPVAVNDDFAVDEDTALVTSASTLVMNDMDVDMDTLTVMSVSNFSNGVASFSSGTVTFTPDANFNGTAGFDYTVSDGTTTDVGHANIVVNAVNDAPVANDQSVQTNEGASVTITLTASDVDLGAGTLLFSIVGSPSAGSLGTIVQASATSATVSYTPNPGSDADDSFTFRANDGATNGSTATVNVDVVPVPVCSDGVIESPETCDDFGLSDGDGCSQTCQVENGFNCTGSPSTCTTTCSDGIVAGTETCDDLGLADGDGCNSSCQIETGWSCAGSPSVCNTVCNDGLVRGVEECDDGDPFDNNGCTTECQSGPVCTPAAFPGATALATDEFSGTCYGMWPASETFGSAYAACVAVGGHMVTIGSQAEQNLVAGLQEGNEWIGASEDGNDNDAVFDWITDDPWLYTNFLAGEPDDDVGFGGNGECLAFVAAGGMWGDTDCNFVGFTTGRICEMADDTCGDLIVQPVNGEQCDDGNTFPFDGCSETCQNES